VTVSKSSTVNAGNETSPRDSKRNIHTSVAVLPYQSCVLTPDLNSHASGDCILH